MAQRMILAIAFLLMAAGAGAAEPDGFKDYKFGMTRAEVEAIGKNRRARYVPSMVEEKIGNISLLISFDYERGADGVERLAKVSFVFDTNREYATIRGAFVERYGNPTKIQYLTFRNGFGAEFKGEWLEWKGAQTGITILEIATGRHGSVSLSTNSYQQRAQDQNSRDVKKAAKDL